MALFCTFILSKITFFYSIVNNNSVNYVYGIDYMHSLFLHVMHANDSNDCVCECAKNVFCEELLHQIYLQLC